MLSLALSRHFFFGRYKKVLVSYVSAVLNDGRSPVFLRTIRPSRGINWSSRSAARTNVSNLPQVDITALYEVSVLWGEQCHHFCAGQCLSIFISLGWGWGKGPLSFPEVVGICQKYIDCALPHTNPRFCFWEIC